jgi:hypothetical protein
MRTSATNKRIRELIKLLKEGKLDPNPDFQRRLVWGNRDKCNFIETILRDLPFPEIYIAAGTVDVNTGDATEMLVDGQQRITTLYQYFIGSPDLKLTKDVKPYSELKEIEKEKFLQYEVVVRDLGRVEIGEIKEVFRRINATRYSLNAMEIHNSRYEGELKKFAEEIAEHVFFEKHRIFSASDIRRMEDTKFSLSIIITLISTYFNRDEALEEYLQKFNDEFPQKTEIRQRIEHTINIIEAMNFPTDSRVWQKSDLFTLIIELDNCIYKQNKTINEKVLYNKLEKFYEEVNEYDGINQHNPDVVLYHTSAFQATNARKNRINRSKIISKIICNSA